MIKRLFTQGIYKNLEIEELERTLDPLKIISDNMKSSFHHGIMKGSLYRVGNQFQIDYEPNNLFLSLSIPDQKLALKYDYYCDLYLKKYNYDNDLVYNKYRFNEDSKGVFIESYADDKIFYCDISDILLFNSEIWHYRESDNKVFCYKKKKGKLESVLLYHFIYDEFTIVKFKDKNTLNYRRYNLSVITPKPKKASNPIKK